LCIIDLFVFTELIPQIPRGYEKTFNDLQHNYAASTGIPCHNAEHPDTGTGIG
jgi:hypothetical protein